MAAVTARRALLPPHALALLAQRAAVPLPPAWAPSGPEYADPAALLAEAGLVDGATGAVLGDLGDALSPLRAPLATIDLTLAPTSPREPLPPDRPAEAFTATVVVGDRGVVDLLRRPGVPLVELTVAGPDALRPSLERLVACVPPAPDTRAVEERLDLVAFTALSGFEGRFDAETFAAAHDCDPGRVAAVAALLGGTTHAFQVLVVGDRELNAPPVGQVLLYRAEPGWLDVSTEGSDVVLRTTEPAGALRGVARLLAGVL